MPPKETFPQVADLLPEGVSGNVRIEHFVVTKEESEVTSLRALFRPGEHVEPGKYARLYVAGEVMMSDTRMERRSNAGAIFHAKGHVLIAGLGIGMIVHPIADKKEVKSITIIEKSPDVIKLVAPSLPKKAKVIEGDIFTWAPPKGTKYGTIYFDIWVNICTDNLDEMATLNRRFARCKTPDAYVNSWQRDNLLSQRRRDRDGWWNQPRLRARADRHS